MDADSSFIADALGRADFSGPVPDLKSDDDLSKKINVTNKVQAKVFDFSNSEDLDEYVKLSQDIIDGKVVQSQHELKYSEKTDNWKVFMRWVRITLSAKDAELS